jgi:hypothetical protein
MLHENAARVSQTRKGSRQRLRTPSVLDRTIPLPKCRVVRHYSVALESFLIGGWQMIRPLCDRGILHTFRKSDRAKKSFGLSTEIRTITIRLSCDDRYIRHASALRELINHSDLVVLSSDAIVASRMEVGIRSSLWLIEINLRFEPSPW